MDLILEVSFKEEVVKMPIFGPLWALGPKKGGTFEKAKKIILRGKILCVSYRGKMGQFIFLKFNLFFKFS